MSTTPGAKEDERWIARCLELAAEAAQNAEVPVGALVVLDDEVVGEGRNRVEAERSPLAHAEMIALQAALRTVGEKRLPTATLYCTLEPCFLCAGAILHTRIRRVVFGARDPKFGSARSRVSARGNATGRSCCCGAMRSTAQCRSSTSRPASSTRARRSPTR